MSKDPPLKILVADPDPTVKAAIRLFSGKDAADVLEAEDGERALLVARTVPLDLVLIEVTVPKLDGIDFTRALRAESALRLRSLPIVLLAVDSNPLLAARARAAGVTELLQKPLSTKGLAALLLRAQRRRASGSGSNWTSVRPPAREEPYQREDDADELKRGA
ncbi:MAG TPA: response regulator [Polyangiaceae bacterium]|jgi:CheY-like chemotaxis protein